MSIDPSFTFHFDDEGTPVPHVDTETESQHSVELLGKSLPAMSQISKVARKQKRKLFKRRGTIFGSSVTKLNENVSERKRANSSFLNISRRGSRIGAVKPRRGSRFGLKKKKSNQKIKKKKSIPLLVQIKGPVSPPQPRMPRKGTKFSSMISIASSIETFSLEEKEREFTHENSEFAFKDTPVSKATINEVFVENIESIRIKNVPQEQLRELEEEDNLEILIAFYEEVRPGRESNERRALEMLAKYELGTIAFALFRKYKKYPKQWEKQFLKTQQELKLLQL